MATTTRTYNQAVKVGDTIEGHRHGIRFTGVIDDIVQTFSKGITYHHVQLIQSIMQPHHNGYGWYKSSVICLYTGDTWGKIEPLDYCI